MSWTAVLHATGTALFVAGIVLSDERLSLALSVTALVFFAVGILFARQT